MLRKRSIGCHIREKRNNQIDLFFRYYLSILVSAGCCSGTVADHVLRYLNYRSRLRWLRASHLVDDYIIWCNSRNLNSYI